MERVNSIFEPDIELETIEAVRRELQIDQDSFKRAWRQDMQAYDGVINCLCFTVFFALLIALPVLERGEMGYQIGQPIREAFVDQEFQVGKGFEDISDEDEFFLWMKGPFFQAIGTKFSRIGNNHMPMVTNGNYILGAVRVVQKRVNKQKCTLPAQYIGTLECYPEYSVDVANMTNIGLANWKYMKDSSSSAEYGRFILINYDEAGHVYDIPLGNISNIARHFEELSTTNWLDQSTRLVQITVNMYNPIYDSNIYATFMIEFTGTGAVYASHSIYITHLNIRPMVILVVLTLAYTIYYTIRIIYKSIKYRSKYLLTFVTVLEALHLVQIWVCTGHFVAYNGRTEKLSIDLSNHSKYVDLATTIYAYETVINLWSFVVGTSLLVSLVYWGAFNRLFTFIETLRKGMRDLVAFLWIFLFCIGVFGIFSFLLFGKIYEFKDINGAIVTCFRALLGDVDVKPLYSENRILGPFTFIVFVFILYFILANMFIAIIVEGYSSTSNRVRDWRRKRKQASKMMRDEGVRQHPGFVSVYPKLIMSFMYAWACVVMAFRGRFNRIEWAEHFYHCVIEKSTLSSPVSRNIELANMPMSVFLVMEEAWRHAEREKLVNEKKDIVKDEIVTLEAKLQHLNGIVKMIIEG